MDMAKAPEPLPPLRTPGYSGAFSQPCVETDLSAKQVWEI